MAALLVCALLSGGALAADVRVDKNMAYCFSASDFAEPARGIYVCAVPSGTVGTLCYGTRVLRAGDVLPSEALDALQFRPVCAEETDAELVYCAIGDRGLGSEQTLSLRIVSRKDTTPVCNDLQLETYKNIANSGTLLGTDEDGDTLTYQIVRQPRRGSVELGEDGSFTYTPAHNKVGRDSFVYAAVDPAGNLSNEATVKIKIVKPTDAATFADLAGDALEYRAMALKDMGVYGGQEIAGQRCFCPDETVTRGEFLVMAMRVLGLGPDDAVLTAGFADETDAPAWMRPYITAAYRCGLISGVPGEDGLEFRPAAVLNEAECAVMMQKMLRLPDADAADVFAASDWEDASVAAWAVPSSAALKAVGIDLRPLSGQSMTRRACAELLYQLSTLCNQDALQDFCWEQ